MAEGLVPGQMISLWLNTNKPTVNIKVKLMPNNIDRGMWDMGQFFESER